MKRKKNKFLQTEARDAWILMAPALVVLCIVSLYPVLRTFYLSLHEMVLTQPGSGFPFIGGKNYTKFFQDARAVKSLLFTFEFSVVTVLLEMGLGFAAAMIMHQKFVGRGIVRASFLIPWAIPTSISSLMFKFIFNDQYGLFNNVLYNLGIIDSYKAWLSTSDGTFLALVITDVWKTFPYVALLILAGLQMIPDELYEAAKIDGANGIQRFFHITIPCMRSTLLVTLLFRTRDAIRVFELIYVMTGGANNSESISNYAYTQLMRFLNFGYGSTLSVIIFVIVLLISLVYLKCMNNKLTEV